jgi:hypothetical protein
MDRRRRALVYVVHVIAPELQRGDPTQAGAQCGMHRTWPVPRKSNRIEVLTPAHICTGIARSHYFLSQQDSTPTPKKLSQRSTSCGRAPERISAPARSRPSYRGRRHSTKNARAGRHGRHHGRKQSSGGAKLLIVAVPPLRKSASYSSMDMKRSLSSPAHRSKIT